MGCARVMQRAQNPSWWYGDSIEGKEIGEIYLEDNLRVISSAVEQRMSRNKGNQNT
jgi:hypothetical protein